MPWHSHLRSYISLTILLLLFFDSIATGYEYQFPLPPQLEKNVQFWKKVFTDYLQDEVIIHDANHIDLIYTIVNLADYYPPETPFRTKWKVVKKIKSEYQEVLKKLSQLRPDDNIESLDPLSQRVYNLWQGVNEPDKFRKAYYNIRGQRGLRERFIQSLERSGKYRTKIEETLAKYHLPSQLCYLPHVESSFDYKAYSKAGAAGLWQFTRSTGRLFLNINNSIDERMDPLIATDAAARLLKKNFEELGSWPLAITAYNHGVQGMKRAKAKVGCDDFGEIVQNYQSTTFGFASRNFYAEFLAAIEIAENYFQYFGYINFEEPADFNEVILPTYTTVGSLAKQFNLAVDELIELNPAWRRSIRTSRRRLAAGTVVRLPADVDVDRVAEKYGYASLDAESVPNDDQKYQVKPGDNLSHIAKKFNTDVDTLMGLNDLNNPDQLYVGQLLLTPSIEANSNSNKNEDRYLGNSEFNTGETSSEGEQVYPADLLIPFGGQMQEESN